MNVSSPLNVTLALRGGQHCPYFIDEVTEARKGQVIGPRSAHGRWQSWTPKQHLSSTPWIISLVMSKEKPNRMIRVSPTYHSQWWLKSFIYSLKFKKCVTFQTKFMLGSSDCSWLWLVTLGPDHPGPGQSWGVPAKHCKTGKNLRAQK